MSSKLLFHVIQFRLISRQRRPSPLANGANCIFFFISTKFRHFPYFRKNYTFPLFPQNLPLFGLITAFCFHLIVTCFTRRPRLPDASESSDRLDRCFKMTQLLMHGRGKGTMAVRSEE